MSEFTQETSVETETTTETEKTRRPRRPNVSNADVIKTWCFYAARTDEDGEKNGTVAEVAEELGMEKANLSQRITALRKKGLDLPKMPRAKGGGNRTNVGELQALLAELNDELDLS